MIRQVTLVLLCVIKLIVQSRCREHIFIRL